MFTGIIKEIGSVKNITRSADGYLISLTSEKVCKESEVDDSISVNGVCLTVVSKSEKGFTVQAVRETVSRTNINGFKPGDEVNLEPALRADGKLDGHIVQGHVDGSGKIIRIIPRENGKEFWIKTDIATSSYIVAKGSVCLDGISLTVAEVKDEEFRVAVIPHTEKNTTVKNWKTGYNINIETDIIGRYIEKFLKPRTEGVTIEKLTDLGY